MLLKFEIEIDTNDAGDMQSIEELIEILSKLKEARDESQDW
jgi:hypothetical protein